MPRTTATRPLAVVQPEKPNSLIASAASLTRDGAVKPRRANNNVREWQGEAWRFYDCVGELRQAAAYIGKALSRINLTVKKRTPGGVETLTQGLAVDALNVLFEGETGRSQMMETLGVHLTVPGESYVVAIPSASDAPDEWMVLSNDEVRPSANGGWSYDRGEGKTPLPDNALVMRIWRPHSRKWIEADSSVRAVLPVLREIEQLSKHISASADSRLAGAGVFLVPSEMTFGGPPTETQVAADVTIDPFLIALTEAMMKPIEDRSSAAAVVPIVIRAPGEVLDKAQHITFSTPFDDHVQGLLDNAIRRLALGMDLPPEIVLGQADSNHWSAWQIDESALKIHVEPLCELIADAFTRKWLWPILEAGGEPDYDTFIGWDTSDLRVRPNHASEAVELYDRGELTGDALRRETGFDESDKPTEEELRQVLLLKLVQSNNDLTIGAAEALGLGINPSDVGTRWQPVPPPQIEPPTGRDRNLPDQEESRAASAFLAASEVLVLRAVERANNRIHRRGRGPRTPCDLAEARTALADAWTNVPLVAARVGRDPDALTSCLDGYTLRLLTEGVEHSPMNLAQALGLREALCLA